MQTYNTIEIQYKYTPKNQQVMNVEARHMYFYIYTVSQKKSHYNF